MLWWVENPPYNQACGLAVGWEAHPTAFPYISGCLKKYILPLYCILPLRWVESPPYKHLRCFGGLKTHPTAVVV
ncbi:MAG: hypothetical protein J5680_05575 [Neisseriaceae bacterium]|nr:hypothetical protein [Neisseriaceae bacterium]